MEFKFSVFTFTQLFSNKEITINEPSCKKAKIHIIINQLASAKGTQVYI